MVVAVNATGLEVIIWLKEDIIFKKRREDKCCILENNR
jgi:hypothetical protein